MIFFEKHFGLRVLALASLAFSASCMGNSSGQSNGAQIVDSSYTCTATYASGKIESNGRTTFKEEWRGAELEAMMRNADMGSLSSDLEIRNSNAIWRDSSGSKSEPVPITRRGNKIFFTPLRRKSVSEESVVYGEHGGYLDVVTNKFLQTVETKTGDGSGSMRIAVSGLCIDR